jgi:hypothetical protein
VIGVVPSFLPGRTRPIGDRVERGRAGQHRLIFICSALFVAVFQ